jgi:predicted small lipoprotein YifL
MLSLPAPNMLHLLRQAELSSSSDLHLAHIAAVAALGIAGCGRKGGLDPPPGATATDTSFSRPDLEPAIGPDGRIIAPSQGPKRSTPLDWLLN